MQRWSVFAFALLGVLLAHLGIAIWLKEDLRYLTWGEPLWLLLILLPVIATAVTRIVRTRPASLRFSRVASASRLPRSPMARLADLPDGLRLAAAVVLVVAMARPQSARRSDTLYQEGIDIAVAIDLSDSMAAEDLPPTRLHAAKIVLDEFIRRRPRDRIALVAFGQSASTVSPLTSDHQVLRSLVSRLRLGVLDGDGTAIGAGVGLALNRLSESEATSKIIVLLTDGVQTAGGIHPDTVAQEAAKREIKVYTILMGRHESEAVDPAQLERIAGATGGFAYTAEDYDTLSASFLDLLDKLERSQLQSEQVRAELFAGWLLAALVLLFTDAVLRNTRLRRFP